ncbi:MAG: DUF4198 domain-containing protein [Pseudomonadota bacterium]
MRVTFLLALAASALCLIPAHAHEFWIDPLQYTVAPGDPVVADIRVGEEFVGVAYTYFPKNFKRSELQQGATATPNEGRLGDRPALTATAEEGLAVLVHQTTDSRVSYSGMEKFRNFVTHKDAKWTLAAHAERGLPEDRFVEVYSRYAKSLIAVGDGAGNDAEAGLEIELVARTNPYTEDTSDGVGVTLLYQGDPRPDAQIEVFEKAPDDSVAVFFERTDATGEAVIPVKPGHRYMVDSVVLREPSRDKIEATGAAWESLWANLTFAVPDKQ